MAASLIPQIIFWNCCQTNFFFGVTHNNELRWLIVNIEQILQSAAFPHIYCFCYHKNYLRIYKTCFQNHSTVFLSLLLTSAIHPWNPLCTSTSSGSLPSGSIPPKYSLLRKSNPMYVPGEVPGNLRKKRFIKDHVFLVHGERYNWHEDTL